MVFCCQYCFEDSFIKKHIIENGEQGNCSFCNRENTECIPPEKLNSVFLPLLNLYSPIENFIPKEELSEYKGQFIWDKLDEDWNIFSANVKEKRSILIKELLAEQIKKGETKLLKSFYEMESRYYGDHDKESKRLETDWNEFSNELKSINRFFPSKKIDLEQLGQLLQTLDIQMDPQQFFFRSRRSEPEKKFPPSKMGKPPDNKTKNGRANPVGISYLYLASDRMTAIHEIRPSIGETVTVARFRLLEPLSIIDLRDVTPFRFKDDEDFETLIPKIGYLSILGTDLSKPINQKDAELDYLPTQYLCEFIKKSGWDGVAYKSSISQGFNLAVFTDKKLKCVRTELHKIQKVILEYKKLK